MKLLKTSFFSAIITCIRIASGFVAGKIVAKFTGPAGIGLIGQFSNFITIVLTFANGAINNGVVKYTAQYDGDEPELKRLFSTALKISLYCSIVVGVVLFVTAPYLSEWMFSLPIYKNPVRVLGLSIVLYSLNTLLISVLNGKKQIKAYTIVNTAGSIVGLILTVILVYLYKIEGALYSLVLAQSVVFFVTLGLVVKSNWFSLSYFTGKFDRASAVKLSHFALMTIISAVALPAAQIALRNLLIFKLGVPAAGYWQGMMRISDGYLLLITTSLSTYYLPKLSSLKTDDDIRKEIFNGYKIIIPAVLGSCLVIYLLRYFLINLLFTPEFRIMESLFAYQLLGDFFKMAAWVLSYLMLAKAMTRVFIATEIVFNLTYVVLGYLCTSWFGLIGVTVAFAINYLLYLIAMLIIFRRILFK